MNQEHLASAYLLMTLYACASTSVALVFYILWCRVKKDLHYYEARDNQDE